MNRFAGSILAGFLILSFALAFPAQADEKILRIYLDADRTHAIKSGLSIEQGVRAAFNEIGYQLAGYRVELVVKDHHANSRRCKRHLEQFLQDPAALAVIGGMHSPPLLDHKKFINQNQIPVLVPWAAAGPITRYPSEENWIFRLSIDDSKAGYVIARHAVQKRGMKKPYLLLENTGWGKSNYKTMSRALAELNIGMAPVSWFNWGVSEAGAKDLVQSVIRSGADGVFLVANAPEGKTIIKALAALPPDKRISVSSHWGITGADFAETVNAATRDAVDLRFIQTRFSFISHPDHSLGRQVLTSLKTLYPEMISHARDIKAPAGLVHAYDLTRLMIAAVKQTGLTGDILIDRQNLRLALENLDTPVEGLVKTYQRPFTVFNQQNPDAHEALNLTDFVMARYGDGNEIIIETQEVK